MKDRRVVVLSAKDIDVVVDNPKVVDDPDVVDDPVVVYGLDVVRVVDLPEGCHQVNVFVRFWELQVCYSPLIKGCFHLFSHFIQNLQ